MQIWAESGKSALPICNYSQILYQFLTFTQNLKRSHMVTSKTSFNVIPALFNTSFGSLIPWLLPHSFTCVCMKNLLTDRRIYLVYTQKTNLSIPYYHSTNKATCVINLLGSVCAGGPSR